MLYPYEQSELTTFPVVTLETKEYLIIPRPQILCRYDNMAFPVVKITCTKIIQ